MKNIYQELGFLILGSRLRRMSEYFLAEVNKVYQQMDIPFEAGWFPIFYILSKEGSISLRSVADELMISHSAVSQLVKNLKDRGLILTICDPQDRRSQLITLSEQGKLLLKELRPI
jgi:DNA-binding MarR family transcriptional regulator